MSNTSADQRRKAETFRALHAADRPFVVANPWDAGTARLLTGLGFAALATTGAGFAYSLGRPDGHVTREEILDNAAAIAGATHLPVSADLESGFGDKPEDVAATIRLAARAGLVGASVEDSTGRAGDPVRPLEEAVERVAAAVAAARELDFPFTVTARAENFFLGRPDLADTIRRLQAYEEAGADVLYAPALPDADAVRAVCTSVGRPVNVLMGGALRLSVPELGELGVRRVSVGSAMSRAAYGALVRAAEEIRDRGTFTFGADALPYADLNSILDTGE
ncbi:isocitrate lyase/phosphoenolpyruvate mutase family protein [Streptomyces sp. WAC05374]|uniref:isocitrate lyase/PEP mutase family protein n=1 Tax=unclassified Streptomyces TaxID=2593676 RepID=UPI000F86947A|nr:isocitrate lyase/phosphoenolpyruvate mutase family protein [Streptomyces sp. WAC05374]RST19062.1 isocitrate lyase/phosphoenolpyruvate mutase family protein [Streptomyces sp. WAC05374]TDF36970.1 isocitrate lyase/phosphoenolpyruvate mutase family protein [Streptomyces sp. WAC05374]TDF46465.1 isocitrate lyase/phosphoenolpyruvate mutase family protein [Streptomyces sp. WAC05374]TDF47566.1 isocitrate lyase/phosphoenolpyruvate mutase family protein [Streptomyces sp. WAC05374]